MERGSSRQQNTKKLITESTIVAFVSTKLCNPFSRIIQPSIRSHIQVLPCQYSCHVAVLFPQ
uniref:Stv3 n=1 Tax=Arundo donax TaxID=35708 RepID=A0A0A9CSM3_ARUDO